MIQSAIYLNQFVHILRQAIDPDGEYDVDTATLFADMKISDYSLLDVGPVPTKISLVPPAWVLVHYSYEGILDVANWGFVDTGFGVYKSDRCIAVKGYHDDQGHECASIWVFILAVEYYTILEEVRQSIKNRTRLLCL